MGDPRAVGAQSGLRSPRLTPPAGRVASDILLRRDSALPHPEFSRPGRFGAIVPKVLGAAMPLPEEPFAILDPQAFDLAAEHLARAVRHRFLRIGVRASAFDDAHRVMSAALPGPDDMAVTFSLAGATMAALEAVALARRKGPVARRDRTMRAVQSKRRT